MSKLIVRVDWENPQGDLVQLTDVQRVNIRKGSDIKHNTLDITLTNSPRKPRPYIGGSEVQFAPEQQINVYVKYDTDGSGIDTLNDLVFAGRVVEYEAILDADKSPLKLKCSDSSFIALNKLWVGDETDTPPSLIIDVIGFINDTITNEDNRISARLTTNGGSVAASKSTGAFSEVTLARTFKPAYEVIQELSQPDKTGDGDVPYRFHVDKNNVFHWFRPDDTASHVLVAGQNTAQTSTYVHPVTNATETVTDSNNHDILNYKLKNAVYDITNFIIYKAGEDMDNVQILDFEYDATTGSPVLKDSFRSWEDIARAMKSADAAAGNITKIGGDDYNYPGSYPVTPAWDDQKRSVSSDSQYNDNFIEQAILNGDSRATSEFQYTGDPRYKGSIELKGSSLFDANDALVFSAPKHGIKNVFLRVKDVQHNIDKTGWFTTLQVEEEVKNKSA